MAEKISKLAIKVDLQCHRCYKKIQKTLCELQVREKITTIAYDEKSNTVTISGPFDPQKLSKKLRCKACKVIKDIQIIVDPPPPPKDTKKPTTEKPPPKDGGDKATKKEPTPEPCTVINDIKIIVDLPKDPKNPEKKPETKPPADPIPEPKPKCEPCHPPVWPVCCCVPCYMPYPGGSRCCSCGKVYGCVADGPPRMAYSGPSHGQYQVCQFICEEDPSMSCTIM